VQLSGEVKKKKETEKEALQGAGRTRASRPSKCVVTRPHENRNPVKRVGGEEMEHLKEKKRRKRRPCNVQVELGPAGREGS
jgi:hypothetical protein